MKRKMIIRGWIIVAAVLMTLAVTLAAAEEKRRPSTYIVARGGVVIPAGDWMNDGWEPRENIEIALGYHFLPFLALEGSYHHFKWYMEQTTPIYLDQKIYADGIVLAPKLIYPLKRFEFYLGAGAGYYWLMDGLFVAIPGVGYSETYDSIWGFHAVAGASYDLLRWLYLELEGRYVILFNFFDKSNITGWALTLGIGFRFL